MSLVKIILKFNILTPYCNFAKCERKYNWERVLQGSTSKLKGICQKKQKYERENVNGKILFAHNKILVMKVIQET